MRGLDERTGSLFSYVDLDDRVPAKHPLRVIRRIVNDVLAALEGEFAKLYAASGRPSIPPERLLRALLLQTFYTIRSETQLMEQLDYNLLYRWFVGLGVDEPVWVQTVFTKNRERLLEAEVAHKFLAELLNHKEVRGLLSDEHFSVDGTQIQAWASMKSFRAKGGSDEPPAGGRNGERDFHGEKRSNDTHLSTTDPEAKLYRKGSGKEAKLSYIGNVMTENRHGLVVEAELGGASGTIERGGGAVNGNIGNKSERCVAQGAGLHTFVSIWAIAHSPGFRGCVSELCCSCSVHGASAAGQEERRCCLRPP